MESIQEISVVGPRDALSGRWDGGLLFRIRSDPATPRDLIAIATARVPHGRAHDIVALSDEMACAIDSCRAEVRRHGIDGKEAGQRWVANTRDHGDGSYGYRIAFE